MILARGGGRGGDAPGHNCTKLLVGSRARRDGAKRARRVYPATSARHASIHEPPAPTVATTTSGSNPARRMPNRVVLLFIAAVCDSSRPNAAAPAAACCLKLVATA